MSVSVIIPTLNGAGTIGPLLRGLKDQTLPPDEIIVVDSSSDDNTAETVRGFGIEPVIIKREDFNHGDTRNMAAGIARGDMLVFMTQDALPVDERMIEELIMPLGDDRVAASFGRHIPRSDASVIEKFARTFNYPDRAVTKSSEDIEALGIRTFFFSNVCSAVKKRAFFEVGRFPGVILNEDMFLASKLILQGYKVAYQPSAKVYHSHDYSPLQQFKRYFDLGRVLKMSNIFSLVEPSGEGKRYLSDGMKYLLGKGRIDIALILLVDSISRYTGFVIGVRYKMVPRFLIRRLSMYGVDFQMDDFNILR